jgi:hypothetical protein
MSNESKEENQDQSAQPRQVNVEFVVPDPESSLFSTYANNIQVTWTYFDVRMLFGEVVDLLPTKMVIEQRAQVTISYLQAKLLIQTLGQAISTYESLFGELKAPPGVFEVATTTVTGNPASGTPARKT